MPFPKAGRSDLGTFGTGAGIFGNFLLKGAATVPRRNSAVFVALVLLMATSAMAATTGKIAGRVTDASGTPLIGATVMIVGTSYGAMTDQNGEYFIINLQPGNYDVVGRMVGMGD